MLSGWSTQNIGGINDLDGDEDHIILGALFGFGGIEDGDEWW